MPSSEVWTIGRLLTWTTQYLQAHGADSPRLDAEVMLAAARHCERIELYTAFDEEADEPLRTRFRELVRCRAAGTPVAYLVDRREFFSLPFHVTRDVLIPRPETEFVVMTLVDRIRESPITSRPVEIADVGVGSGVISVCTAKQIPDCRITAIDISRAALQVARENIQAHGVADRVQLLEGDLLSDLPPGQQFDFVASNPPYVSEAEYGDLPHQVKGNEPRVALLAGPSGTEVIGRLISQAGQRLRTGGWLITEISPMIERAVHEQLSADGRFDHCSTIKDLSGLARVVQAQRRPTKDAQPGPTPDLSQSQSAQCERP